jgi:hypothetical protein
MSGRSRKPHRLTDGQIVTLLCAIERTEVNEGIGMYTRHVKSALVELQQRRTADKPVEFHENGDGV